MRAWVNGERLAPGQTPQVSMLDRGFLLGDSVFETLRWRAGRAIAWPLHAERLRAACAAFGLSEDAGMVDEMFAVGAELARELGEEDVTVRVTVSRGVGGSGLAIAPDASLTRAVWARQSVLYPAHAYATGIETCIVQTRRIPRACLDTRFKSGCYLPAVQARRELGARLEGIMLTVDGRVASGTVSNVFLVRDGVLCTPGLDSDCRDGVTRTRILALAARHGIPTREGDVSIAELETADEVFFCNTLMECLPVQTLTSVELPGASPRRSEVPECYPAHGPGASPRRSEVPECYPAHGPGASPRRSEVPECYPAHGPGASPRRSEVPVCYPAHGPGASPRRSEVPVCYPAHRPLTRALLAWLAADES